MASVRIHVVAGAASGRVLELDAPQIVVVGRAPDVELSVPGDTALSRRHMQLEIGATGVIARDLKSRHGMFVNGKREPEMVLANGDRVQVGETVLRLELVVDPTNATTLVLAGTMPGHASAPDPYSGRARCGCGAVATDLAPTGDDVSYLCDRCQEQLTRSPLMPPDHELVRVLGRGAMGCVYLARETTTGELRAIKQILPKAAMSAQMRKLFAREAAVQAGLDHPNIVRVHALVEQQGCFSLVMEYVDGVGADHLLQDERVAPPELVIEIGIQALDGLAYAHARNIVHRDIKEANLLICSAAAGASIVKVADFGLAKNFHESGASGITNDGTMGGTLPYMSREQLLDFKYVKPPADIYSLGASLYRLLTGCFPRDFPEHGNWILAALEQPIVPIAQRARGRDVPRALCAVVEQALERDLQHRYQTATAMRDALAAIQ